MGKTIHVFSGVFKSDEEAKLYTEEQWEQPAPDDSWPEEKYTAWENRNPVWKMREDLGVGSMDSDFVETIRGPRKIHYLGTQIRNEENFASLKNLIPADHDTLVLVMSDAFDSRKVTLRSTGRLLYHGEYLWNL